MLALGSVVQAATPTEQALRVVSVGGAITEIVYLLDAAEQLVGVDTTSQYPVAAAQLPPVGYQRQLSAEGVLSLRPDVLLVSTEAGPAAVLEQLAGTGLKIVTLSAEPSPAGVVEKIQGVAAALNKSEAGAVLIERFQTQMAATQAKLATEDQRPKVVFLLNVGGGSPMAAGHSTAAHAMIELAGGINAFGTSHQSYKPISTEAMIAANPDILLLSKDTLAAIGGMEAALALPGVKLTTAGQQQRIATLDGLYILGFGPRLPEAVAELAELFQAIPTPQGTKL